MKALAALPLLALVGCSVCQPTRFTWPVFDDPIAMLIMADDGGRSSAPASAAPAPAASGGMPSAPVAEQPSAPAAETPSPSTETPSANDGVGGQQEPREESHDRG